MVNEVPKVPKNLYKMNSAQAYKAGYEHGVYESDVNAIAKGIEIGKNIGFIALYNVIDQTIKTEKTQNKTLQNMDKEMFRILAEELSKDYSNVEILMGRINEVNTKVGIDIEMKGND